MAQGSPAAEFHGEHQRWLARIRSSPASQDGGDARSTQAALEDDAEVLELDSVTHHKLNERVIF
jgi:hypothetical protein